MASLPAAETSVTPLRVRVVERALHGGDDRPLLGLVRGAVGRIVRAVEQPRVDVVAHVHDVDADVAGVGERVDRRLQEEVARSPGPARRFTSVTFGATPAMPSPLIGEPIVEATCVPWPSSSTSAGSLHDWSGSSSHGPSISSPLASTGMSTVKLRLRSVGEVRCDVGVAAVDAGVEDADEHACGHPARPSIRPVHGRVDLLHVPLQIGEGLGVRAWVAARCGLRIARTGRVRPSRPRHVRAFGLRRALAGPTADGRVVRHALDARLRRDDWSMKSLSVGAHGRDADLLCSRG